MKIPASSSLLIATLAVSSSSSALAAPSGEGHQESSVKSSSSRTALVSSASSDMSERDPIVERGIESIAYPGLPILNYVQVFLTFHVLLFRRSRL